MIVVSHLVGYREAFSIIVNRTHLKTMLLMRSNKKHGDNRVVLEIE